MLNNMEMLNEIFQLCIIPLLGILTKFIVNFINKKMEEASQNIDNSLAVKYMNLLTDTIKDCVITTNQTYVNALKDKDAFDEAAQKEALQKTKDEVLKLLTDDAKVYLANIYGDLNELISVKIESTVAANK